MDNDLDLARHWRNELKARRQTLADTYCIDHDAPTYLSRHAAEVDRAVQGLWRALGFGDQATLIAVGGYGRGQLFPCSDIDVLILLPQAAPTALTDNVTRLISLMWDIGLEVGHSVRTQAECLSEAAGDITIETNMLEQRLIAGDRCAFDTLAAALDDQRDPLAFFEGKTMEQQQRHNRFFGVTNNLEPNLKESPGGLRDLQTLIWISKAIGLGDTWDALVAGHILTPAEARLIKHGERQLQRLRIFLHLLARRREDRLIFDLQQQLGLAFGLPDSAVLRASEQVMQLYYRAARTVSQLNGILLPNLRGRLYSQVPRVTQVLNDHFYSVNGMLGIRRPDVFDTEPSAILEAFLMLQRYPELTGFAPRMLRALWHARTKINERFRQDPANQQLFLQILRTQGLTRSLRRMNLYGVLGKYLPAFGKIVGQMQHDLFHVYTVDEHILMVVRNLRRFAISAFNHEYPFLSRLSNDFERPETLYIAGLFHDIAKGRGGDHSQLGTVDAREFCERHGLPPEDTDLVVWLTAQHLTMSHIAQKQDIYDPETVQRFADLVGTPRRLSALYLLTVADIRGTSPKVWNAWKAKLLEDLYLATLKILMSGGAVDTGSELEARKQQARALLRLYAVPDGAEEKLWARLDIVYFLRHEAREIAWHARVLNRVADSQEPVVRARLSDDKEGIQVLVYTPDQPALFARICAFFGRAHYSIADAKVYTTANGYALDTFHVFIPESFDGDYRDMINFIEFELAASLRRDDPIEPPVDGRISRHLKYFPITPQVLIRPDDKANYFVLSIVAGDRPGMLARIAAVLTEHRLTVHSAKIMTLGSRAEDSFLITGPGLTDDKTVVSLESQLFNALRI
ncbi:MAG: [protein-PII] uridylyltransferase [Paludibacterium sp.]|uniref:[protein-PII] uridylyltransferase n=1 Tax=Paludibacterium sp. TaxID=1917523 RepID=UPI0025EAED5B|nr:[protein-PII] uridylyltransferase [Paludibacterium sp.]MBV8046335.1 [protein-PII] uridylyltransferase [Paludibacterium sp.]MBV8649549.1 [protein-PII] uridylyltransferase [Paludibacterium sp.]